MYKKYFLSICCSFLVLLAYAQEFQARITINSDRLSTQTEKRIFSTLQTTLTNFVNNRKWTNDVFQPNEKIQCNILINLAEDLGNNVFKGQLTIQAARPVYNSTYNSPLINLQDNDLVFKYVDNQIIEFNENRVQGNDPVVANLPATIAYYLNIVLGLDYGSYGLKGGELYFRKAMNIVNNAPETRDIIGWKAFDGQRNRYWLAENLTSNRYAIFHDAIYYYYRRGFDLLGENEEEGRVGVMNSLNYLTTLNKENPNSMIMQTFFQGRGNELAQLFSKAGGDVKQRAKELLIALDLTNANLYNNIK